MRLLYLFSFLPLTALLGGLAGPSAPMMEICDNALDDDGDGLTDLNDPQCACALFEPTSRIPNPSFEDRDCCPQERSQLNCARGWIQASAPTTDLISECGWLGFQEYVTPQPFPDGESVMGFRNGLFQLREMGDEQIPQWKEYAGACLIQPLQKDQDYRIEFYVGFADFASSPPINISFFGTPSCDYLPFGDMDVNFGCPTNGNNWELLSAVFVNRPTGGGWVQAALDVTPDKDIAAIAIGPPCRIASTSANPYYFFDDLVLDELKFFNSRITAVNHPCNDRFSLEFPEDDEAIFQWYKDGIALIGETAHRLSGIRGAGRYEVVFTTADGCRVAEPYNYERPVIYERPNITICAGETYRLGDIELTETGVYRDTIISFQGCDSIVRLDLTVRTEEINRVSARIFPGETYFVEWEKRKLPGRYDFTLTDQLGCDSLVLLDLSYYQLFTPTAFSPNGDGLNDTFTVLGGDDLTEVRRLAVYDRWGAEVYVGDAWDGRSRDGRVNPGLFAYVATVVMDDGKAREVRGAVLLVL